MLMSLRNMALSARCKFMNFVSNEEGEVNIVTIVVLIGIAVALALFFKDEITDLLGTLFGTIEDQAVEAVSGE